MAPNLENSFTQPFNSQLSPGYHLGLTSISENATKFTDLRGSLTLENNFQNIWKWPYKHKLRESAGKIAHRWLSVLLNRRAAQIVQAWLTLYSCGVAVLVVLTMLQTAASSRIPRPVSAMAFLRGTSHLGRGELGEVNAFCTHVSLMLVKLKILLRECKRRTC